ncbi:MAG: aldose 1-epimerase family protein [Oscillospiraceae bacterium]|nr:aldose 1-epimerase family protein [Oscillospiraceae bacterium]
MDKAVHNPYIGNLAQLFDLKTAKLIGGKADGMVLSTLNSENLSFSISASRCMDISTIRYKGINVSYISPVGLVAPEYYESEGAEWLRGFTAGVLTTCGLSNIGSPCTVDGEAHGLHGRISHIPAENYNAYIKEENGSVKAVFEGVMNHSKTFGDNLSLYRKITHEYASDTIVLEDTITNKGFKDAVHMQLYHFNFGYPLLDESCEVFTNENSVYGRNEHAQNHIDTRKFSSAPETDYEEMCYYFDLKEDEGLSSVILFNHNREIGVLMRFSRDTLDHFTQWKNMLSGGYVMGLEPGNAWVDGREKAVNDNDYKILKPNESVKHTVSLTFFDSKQKLSDYIKAYNLK